MQNEKRNWLWVPTGIACAAALYASIGHPSEYGFYVAARITVTIAAVILAFYLGVAKREGLCVACIGAAVIFNPFIPLHLGRSIWMLLDLAVVILLLVGTLQVLGSSKGESSK